MSTITREGETTMKNKTTLVLLALFSMMLSMGIANAIEVSIENYYPTPVEAGNYFTAWLKISNPEENPAIRSGVKFEPSYPFSLDPGEEKEAIIEKLEAGGSVTKSFKVRVDKEAKEGENNIAFDFKDCDGCIWNKKTMPITVIEYQTMFDVVLQEVTPEGVFIAIANIGKNSANAVTVSVPEQESFRTELVSSSIVGNLASGDYTLAGFKILPQQADQKEKQPLSLQIAYTDPFGVRRTVVKQIMLSPASLSKISMAADIAAGRAKQNSSLTKNMWFWTTLGLALIAALLALKRTKKRGN